MNINKYIPQNPVNLFIEKILHINMDMQTLYSNQNIFIPNGRIALVIHLKNSMMLQKKCSSDFLPMMFFVGLLNHYANLKPLGDLTSVFIIFKPNALYNLFKIDMNHLNKCDYINAVDVLGNSAISLYDQLFSVKNADDRFHIIENYFDSYLHGKVFTVDIIDHIVKRINKDKGCIRVNDITEYFNIAERTLYHKFMIQTGLSPKEFIRVIRFENILRHLNKFSYENSYDIINNYDLYDQSHFIKEVKNFTGHTPKSIVSLNLDLIQAINCTIE
ncbi:MAG TPA: helix-turn-helix domain-containing protein [Chitinispirillaceae bacterium]|nr:helix-turn-helix domain-containing protein [Chitinispirillaceae bacterium]